MARRSEGAGHRERGTHDAGAGAFVGISRGLDALSDILPSAGAIYPGESEAGLVQSRGTNGRR